MHTEAKKLTISPNRIMPLKKDIVLQETFARESISTVITQSQFAHQKKT